MSSDEFNEKYELFLEEGHYGLDINLPDVVEYLDAKFQSFITVPDFSYSQIKKKFGHGRFYCEGLSTQVVREVEEKITELCKT